MKVSAIQTHAVIALYWPLSYLPIFHCSCVRGLDLSFHLLWYVSLKPFMACVWQDIYVFSSLNIYIILSFYCLLQNCIIELFYSGFFFLFLWTAFLFFFSSINGHSNTHTHARSLSSEMRFHIQCITQTAQAAYIYINITPLIKTQHCSTTSQITASKMSIKMNQHPLNRFNKDLAT